MFEKASVQARGYFFVDHALKMVQIHGLKSLVFGHGLSSKWFTVVHSGSQWFTVVQIRFENFVLKSANFA